MTSVSRVSVSHHKNRFCTFQRLLFNHMGDGALPRSDPNLSAPEKGKRRRPLVLRARGSTLSSSSPAPCVCVDGLPGSLALLGGQWKSHL